TTSAEQVRPRSTDETYALVVSCTGPCAITARQYGSAIYRVIWPGSAPSPGESGTARGRDSPQLLAKRIPDHIHTAEASRPPSRRAGGTTVWTTWNIDL